VERLRAIGAGAVGIVAGAIGYGIGVLFIAMMFGGGVYRTECTLENGTHMQGWDLGDSVPYLWSPGDDRCEAHTLTRYVLGKVGVMDELE
jgi:hypothetical protein